MNITKEEIYSKAKIASKHNYPSSDRCADYQLGFIEGVEWILSQNSDNTNVLRSLEVLAQLLKEEYKLAEDKTLPFFKSGMHYANTSSIEDVIKLLKERPPMT